MSYFQVNVEIVDITEKGKQSKIREQYLVDAVSVTDAETKVHKLFEVLKTLKFYK